MKNKILIISLLCFYVINLTACESKISNLNSKGKNIICYGDSLTAGEGVEPKFSYPSLLAKEVNYPVINAGMSGESTTEGLKRIKTDVLEKNPYLVIIEFGGNDYLEKMSLEDTYKNLEEMIKQIKSSGAIIALVETRAGLVMGEYSSIYRRLSRKYNTILVPNILDGIFTQPKLKSDYVHPNAEGYRLMSQRVLKAIKPYLKGNHK
ncbi:MAG: GDSL-type esterase/lipase family protein [Candidatus Omnitrophota bacterium]